MGAISNIVLADQVPTNHTFEPQTVTGPTALWIAREGTIYAGHRRISAVYSQPSSQRRTMRCKISLFVPHEVTVDDVVRVDTAIYTLESVLPQDCTPTQGLMGYTLFKNLLAHATIQSYVADGKPVY